MKSFLSRLGMWLLERLEEKSTYTGFVLLAVALGRHIPQEIYEVVTWWVPFVATGLMAATTKGTK